MHPIDARLAPFADDLRFTGEVSGVHLRPAGDPELNAYVVHFDSGARTAWHSHERGQLLICTMGAGYVGRRDGTVIELGPGVSVWTEPGEEHWHGAGPDGPMSHVAVQNETPGSTAVDWLEPSTAGLAGFTR